MSNTKTLDAAIAAKKKVTDGAYIPIIQTDGSLAQIAKADLAKVVGGLNAKFSTGQNTVLVKILDINDNISGSLRVRIDQGGIWYAEAVICVRKIGTSKNVRKVAIANADKIQAYIDPDFTTLYLDLQAWAYMDVTPQVENSDRINVIAEESTVDKSTLTTIQ